MQYHHVILSGAEFLILHTVPRNVEKATRPFPFVIFSELKTSAESAVLDLGKPIKFQCLNFMCGLHVIIFTQSM